MRVELQKDIEGFFIIRWGVKSYLNMERQVKIRSYSPFCGVALVGFREYDMYTFLPEGVLRGYPEVRLKTGPKVKRCELPFLKVTRGKVKFKKDKSRGVLQVGEQKYSLVLKECTHIPQTFEDVAYKYGLGYATEQIQIRGEEPTSFLHQVCLVTQKTLGISRAAAQVLMKGVLGEKKVITKEELSRYADFVKQYAEASR